MTLLVLLIFPNLSIQAKEVKVVIPGTRVSGDGEQTADPSACKTTTTFRCAGSGNCKTVVYDDGKGICRPDEEGSSLIPEGTYCSPFPVVIVDEEDGTRMLIPQVFIYKEQKAIDVSGLLYRVYEFTNNDCN